MPIRLCKPIYIVFFKLYSARTYVVLYNAFSVYDYPSLYNEIFVEAAIAVTQVTDFAMPSGYITKPKHSSYMLSQILFLLVKRNITICWIKYIDRNLKFQHENFGKVSSFVKVQEWHSVVSNIENSFQINLVILLRYFQNLLNLFVVVSYSESFLFYYSLYESFIGLSFLHAPFWLIYSSTLRIAATRFSKASGNFCLNAWRHIPEENICQTEESDNSHLLLRFSQKTSRLLEILDQDDEFRVSESSRCVTFLFKGPEWYIGVMKVPLTAIFSCHQPVLVLFATNDP